MPSQADIQMTLKSKSSPRQEEIKCSAKSFAVGTGILRAQFDRHWCERKEPEHDPDPVAPASHSGRPKAFLKRRFS